MSDLNFIEKTKLEKLLGMASGYVLDFSNRTFDAFVADSTQKNIFDLKYDKSSGSKANRLRAFWDCEHNDVVGKLLYDLLDYREMLSPDDDEDQRRLHQDCRRIAERLRTAAPNHLEQIILGNLSIEANSPSPALQALGAGSDRVTFGIVTALEKSTSR